MKLAGLTRSLLLTVSLLLVAVAPAWLAIHITERQVQQSEAARAMDFANEVLHRSEVTADQINSAVTRLVANNRAGHAPCSESSLSLMDKIDLESSQLQAVGYVSGEKLRCSSMGMEGKGLPLGPTDCVAPDEVHIRRNVHFPFAPELKFAVIEQDSYAAIIHPDVPVDVSDAVSGLVLATLSMPSGRVIIQNGAIDPEWIRQLGKKSSTQFVDGYRVVAIATSKRHPMASIAVLPLDAARRQEKTTLEHLLPVATLAGLLLAVGLFYLTRQQQSLPNAIRAGLRNNEFHMVYQPIVDARSKKWVGAEALIRWKRRDGQSIRPDLFIPIAEDSGLITQITERVIALVEKDARHLFALSPDFRLSINLAAADLEEPSTLERLRRMAERTGAGPGNLSLEITERSFVRPGGTKQMIDTMRAAGFSVALDDFGTGYSSLSTLGNFSLDYIKIDKSFVEAIGTGAPTEHVVRHIVELAKGLQLDLIAEGVETELQAGQLRELGVNQMQGWLYSRPIAMADLLKELAAH